jgi:flagellar protein FliS
MDLVVMCYDQAIHSLRQARTFYDTGAFEEKGRALRRALDVLHELRGALDLQKGGEIARNLDSLYGYLTGRILRGDLEKDLKAFDEGIQLLSTLKGAWQEIAQKGDWAQPGLKGDGFGARHSGARAAA